MNLKISLAEGGDKPAWNSFVARNYPPVGAFMASWEWGEFQKNLGRQVERYWVKNEGCSVAAFTLTRCALPLGLSYGYAPRGPVLDANFFNTAEKTRCFFEFVASWIKENFSGRIFARLEPPITHSSLGEIRGFIFPDYCVQPRQNLAVNLKQPMDKILAEFHSSTRANVKKAQRKGVAADLKTDLEAKDWDVFFKMAGETVQRNNGKNIYPPRNYFEVLVQTMPNVGKAKEGELSRGVFVAEHENEPAAMNLVLFFGGTATYLFGASATAKLPSKVTTYLHWQTMEWAKNSGYGYYDLGGIDGKLWPSLTVFKKRFGGEEFEYLGNLDVPIRPWLYRAYNISKKLLKR